MKRRQLIFTFLILLPSIFPLMLHAAPYYAPTEYVSVCKNKGSYVWHKQNYNSTGVYQATSEAGDTIYTLNLVMEDEVMSVKRFDIPQGDSIEWRGKVYSTPGTYTDTIYGSATECDTIIQIVVNYSKDVFHEYSSTKICGDSILRWHGKIITKTGDYTYTLRNKAGTKDSIIYHLHVDKYQDSYREESFNWCNDPKKLPFRWQGIELSEAGTYEFHFNNQAGCDSTVIIHLTLLDPPEKQIVKIPYCQYEGYTAHGQYYREDKTFTSVFTTDCGCDSIIDSMFVSERNTYIPTVYIRENINGVSSPYKWRGIDRTEDKVYTEKVPNRTDPTKCDTVYELTLKSSYKSERTWTDCKGQVIPFTDKSGAQKEIKSDCDIEEKYTSIQGTDSVVTHKFRFSDAQYFSDSMSICANDTFYWYWNKYDVTQVDTIYGANGTQTYKRKNKSICYFTELTVTVFPVFKQEETIFMSKDTFDLKGFTWKDAFGDLHTVQKAKDTTITAFRGVTHIYESGKTAIEGGCDSTSILHFICHPYTEASDPKSPYTLCEGSSITIRGKTYTEPGEHFDIVKSSTGYMDQILNFRIVTPEVISNDSILNGCTSSYPYAVYSRTFGGELYYREYTSAQRDTIPVKYKGKQCDSLLVCLDVKINDRTIKDTIYDTLCGNREFELPSGKIVEKPAAGICLDSWYDEDPCGCPIVQPHHFTILKSYDRLYTVEKNLGETFIWKRPQGDTAIVLTDETKGKTYISSFSTYQGCDSIMRYLLKEGEPFYKNDTVVICSKELPYVWRNRDFEKTGDYYDSLKTTCCDKDSVYHLRLVVNNDTIVTRDLPLYGTQEYVFAGHKLNGTDHLYKTYSDSLLRKFSSCDSIDQVHIVPATVYLQTDTICDNLEEGLKDTFYYDTLKNGNNWLVTKHTRIYPKPVRVYTSATINVGDSIPWIKGGDTIYLKEQGVYYDSCHSSYGCDSVNILTLTIKRDYFFEETDSVCQNDLPYTWHKQNLTQSGVYYDSLKSKLGRDSVYQLALTVLKPIIVYKDTDIFYSGSVTIGGQVYTQAGTVKEYFYTKQLRCDSMIIVWNITKCGGYAIQRSVAIESCDNQPVKIGDTVFAQPGHYTYLEEIKTMNGCDSLVTYTIHIYPTYSFKDSIHLCNSDTGITWHNKMLTKPGVYYDSCTTIYGCDSVYCLKLTYSQPIIADTTIWVCSSTYTYKGKVYSKDSTFVEKTLDVHGCDSFALYRHYRICQACSEYDRYPLCPNDTIIRDGLKISSPGFYEVAHKTQIGGLDSLHRFEVYKAENYSFTFVETACDSFEYEGMVYRQSFSMENPLRKDHKSIDGCDSITYLVLTLGKSNGQTYTRSIADFDSTLWNGTYYKTAGTYTKRFENQSHCDSLEVLNLKVYTTIYDTIDKGYCIGDPQGVEFGGKIYYPTRDTMFSDTTGRGGEIPYVRRMRVFTGKPFTITSFDSLYDQIVCASPKTDFQVKYSIADPTAYPHFYKVRFIENGIEQLPKDSTYEITNHNDPVLPISMELKSQTCIYPGYYRYEITFLSKYCECTSSVQGSLLVRYPETVMAANWDNVVAIVNEENNIGHWKFQDNYQWTIYGQGGDKTHLIAPADPTQPYIYSNLLRSEDRISVQLMRESYSIPIPSCEYYFKPVPTSGTNTKPIIVYPTAVSKTTAVHIETEGQGEYTLYNPTGHKCRQGAVAMGDNTLPIPGATGCYLLQVTLQDGTTQLERLIVY